MRKRLFILSFLAVCAFAACETVHEFPEEGREEDPTKITTTVHVKCRLQLSGIRMVTKESSSEDSDDQNTAFDSRFIIDIYDAEQTDTLVESHLIVRDVEDTSAFSIDTELKARKYTIAAWMDYVKKGSVADLYYCTGGGLEAIHLPEPSEYVGGTDFKDAQTFRADIDLTPYADQWYADITIPAPLERPMAKVTLYASDLETYASSIGSTTPLEELAAGMEINVSYNGYFPTGFNAVTGKLNDSETGYGFKSSATYPVTFNDSTYTIIGSDCIFVNGESSSVTISVVIKDKNGNKVNETGSIAVPIYKNKETVLIYKFFTKEYVPGIGIDPGFDGEFNVYV